MLQTISSWNKLARRLGISSRRSARQKHSVHRKLFVEPLEDKRLLTTYFVENLEDDGVGSLRQAVIEANEDPGFDTISFAAGVTGTINLLSEIDITDRVEIINHTGRDNLIIDGGGATRLFHVPADTTFERLTFANYGVAA